MNETITRPTPTPYLDYLYNAEVFVDYLPYLLHDLGEYLCSLACAFLKFLFLYVILGYISSVVIGIIPRSKPRKRVLFVTAHPDDEAMFFGPTIIRLKAFCDIYLLCLSYGNAYNKGNVRKRELWASCKVLGIPDSNITLKKSPHMPDDPRKVWNVKKVCDTILNHIENLRIDEVYTFDIGGVSGHFNHTSIYYGFAYMMLTGNIPEYCRVYTLETINMLRKYSVFFDATLSLFPFANKMYTVSLGERNLIRMAMGKHESQMVWFRRLYFIFSRYVFINTYKKLELEDVTLVLMSTDQLPMELNHLIMLLNN